MVKPVEVFIDRKKLIGYTDLRLARDREEMTGELNISIFMNWMPKEPVIEDAVNGKEILVYIGGHLAFVGRIDQRKDTAKRHGRNGTKETAKSSSANTGGSVNLNIGPNEYTVRLTCRGKTKYLIDSSHRHPTGNIMRPSALSAIETLLEPFGVSIKALAKNVDLDKVRFRDGGHVADEIRRIGAQCGWNIHESRDGKLRISDGSQAATVGEPLVLGHNILSFSSNLAEDWDRSDVLVKGLRTERTEWGFNAAIPTLREVLDTSVIPFVPTTVHQYGNARQDLLQRRAVYEKNRRLRKAKTVDIEVFHVQQTTGEPWDLGDVHYVEIAPAGIFEPMEVVRLSYIVQADNVLKTVLTLSPPSVPVDDSFLKTTSKLLADVPEFGALASIGKNRRLGGLSLWGGPSLKAVEKPLGYLTSVAGKYISKVFGSEASVLLQDADNLQGEPPLTLKE